MNHRLLDVVVLARDIPARGLRKGDIGTIVEVHGREAFEVEIATATGHAQAILTLTPDDFRAAAGSDIPTVRQT